MLNLWKHSSHLNAEGSRLKIAEQLPFSFQATLASLTILMVDGDSISCRSWTLFLRRLIQVRKQVISRTRRQRGAPRLTEHFPTQ